MTACVCTSSRRREGKGRCLCQMEIPTFLLHSFVFCDNLKNSPPQQEHCLSHGLTNGRAGAKPERVCDYAWGSPTVCQRWIGAVAPTDRAPVWPYPVKGAVADSQDE
eukprot:EG_transcript_65093